MDMIGIDMYNTKHNEKSNNMLPCNMSRVTNAFFFRNKWIHFSLQTMNFVSLKPVNLANFKKFQGFDCQ